MQNLFMHGSWLEQILMRIGTGQGLSVGWKVIEIVRPNLRQLNGLQRKFFEVGLRCIERTVRTIKAHGHKERFFASLPPFLNCPSSHLIVPGFFFGMIMRAALSPKIRLGVGKITANVLGTIQVLIDLPLQRIISVSYFPSAYHPVAVLFEVPL